MEKVWQIANLYVATLRQIYLTHTYSHWTTRGRAFYSNHQLFERLYKSAADDADTAAEKMIGLFGLDGVDYDQQTEFMNKLAKKYASLNGEPLEMSLKIEEDFLTYSKDARLSLKEEGVLSDGLDDMIMAIANSRETSVYLLKQTLDEER